MNSNDTLILIKDFKTQDIKEELFCYSLTIGNKEGQTVIKYRVFESNGEAKYKQYFLNAGEYLYIQNLNSYVGSIRR